MLGFPDDCDNFFEFTHDLSDIFDSLQELSFAHVLDDRPFMGPEFEYEAHLVLISDLLEERNPFVSLFFGSWFVEDDLGLVKEDVQRLRYTKQLLHASGLDLVAVVAEPITLAVLHHVGQLLVNLGLPLATDLSQQRRAVLR
jgi:hypothetical protein